MTKDGSNAPKRAAHDYAATHCLPYSEAVAVLFGHDRVVLAHTFSPDGQVLVTGGGDRTVRLWNLG